MEVGRGWVITTMLTTKQPGEHLKQVGPLKTLASLIETFHLRVNKNASRPH